MLVTILYRMENSPENDGISGFNDVENNKWYSKAIKWAVEKEIVHGYDGTNEFGPNNNILRQDLAVVFRNYAKSKGKNVDSTLTLSGFSDISNISAYAVTSMRWAVENKVITGNSNGTLNPVGLATRAEAAAIVQKYCVRVEGYKDVEPIKNERIVENLDKDDLFVIESEAKNDDGTYTLVGNIYTKFTMTVDELEYYYHNHNFKYGDKIYDLCKNCYTINHERYDYAFYAKDDEEYQVTIFYAKNKKDDNTYYIQTTAQIPYLWEDTGVKKEVVVSEAIYNKIKECQQDVGYYGFTFEFENGVCISVNDECIGM